MMLRAAMTRRLGQPCVHVPSARLGLYLALRHWTRPGDRILIAPTNCETVVFTALAAGLEPVMAPISIRDGNIDLARVDYRGIACVVTTHLYGQPDRIVELEAACRERGIVLVDDAAHALGVQVAERPLGTFGDVGVLSLAKHGRAMSGGLLTSTDTVRLAEAARTRDTLLRPGTWHGHLSALLRPMAREAIARAGLTGPVWQAMTALGLARWEGHRLAACEPELRAALATPLGDENARLSVLDRWLRVDQAAWRTRQTAALRRYQLTRVRTAERERGRRIAGVERLRATPWAADGVKEGLALPLLRVPLLVRQRDDVVRALERRGVVPGFVYDPPLSDYLALIRPGPAHAHTRWWTRHVLPVDPLHAERVEALLTELGVHPAPALHDVLA
ncbi:DegT/DnrJ/EryC1/StrS family aminotransferase [Nonomuraea diastatica]|uniref:DegT/DnrJ/EryC1/StrS aminotransferase family protein n=1 Tax=Nonomuraea diastatica TaxID=1848329 RepID=A0A4R4WL40_9ACTN|nr:DegT/DnrJ/EryC1/StrS family aminotransferase [Nonomuraea diastatica]TDD17163.1 DegT/DnrJ/EryC1/StrS aminotransferase family protein [Nonomuraea diastatica]